MQKFNKFKLTSGQFASTFIVLIIVFRSDCASASEGFLVERIIEMQTNVCEDTISANTNTAEATDLKGAVHSLFVSALTC